MIGDASDERMAHAVANELDWEPRVNSHTVAVSAHDGAVTLAGGVHTYAERVAAVKAAERVYGVRAVTDEITVNLPHSDARKDEDITEEITRLMHWSSAIPAGVKADVNNGHVTLRGEVEWNFQRDEAARAIRYLTGVHSVINEIVVKAQLPKVTDVTKSVRAAIERLADLDARSVWVTASNGSIYLHGHVHTMSQWRSAGRAAAAAPGMTNVVNDIHITP